MTVETAADMRSGEPDPDRILADYRRAVADRLNRHILDALKRCDGTAVFRLVDGQLCLDEVCDAAGGSRADQADDVVTSLTSVPITGVEVRLNPVALFGPALIDVSHDPDGAILTIDVGELAAACR